MSSPSGDNGTHNDGECSRVSSSGIDSLRMQHHDAIFGGNTPVVVLSASVDVIEGLFLQERREAVTSRNLLDDLHDHQVLINLGGVVPVQWGEFVPEVWR
eukprot:CCRYP_021159-RA/>CCRYP_021159-RA protein AED:0.09 eAED:0.09 QI:405/1/1/1/0/0/2/895/99